MTASRQSSLAVQGLGFLESLWSRGEEGLLLSGVLPATLIIVGAVALPGWKPCPWSLNSPVLLKREKHVSSNLSSWVVMFSNEEENDAVLHLPVNIFPDCTGECCGCFSSPGRPHPPTPTPARISF